jgi:uncharacterized protein (DUF58 family)
MTLEEILKRVRAIEVAQKKKAKDKLMGDYQSAFRGSGMQFKEFRNYVFGDDVRHISWNVSARTQDPVLKTFEEERERALFLIVDVSSSLRRGTWAVEKSYKLAEAAAALALTAFESRDKLGLLLFSDKVERVIPPKKGKSHLMRVIRDVLAFEPTGKSTAPDLAMKTALGTLKKKSMVFLLSDLEVVPSDSLVRKMSSKHLFATIQVEHASEREFQTFPGFIEFESAEAQRLATVDASQSSYRNFVSEFQKGRTEEIQNHFERNGSPLITLGTDDDSVKILSHFFKIGGFEKRRLSGGRG